jgi:hypothetical protein
MSKIFLTILIPLAISALATRASAQSESIPRTYSFEDCVPTASAKTKCTFSQTANLYGVTSFPMRFDIEYSFPCRGHRVGLAWSFRGGSQALEFSEAKKVVTVEGPGPLDFKDLNADTTRRATLIGECSVKIHSLSAAPTMDVLLDWKANSSVLVANIKDARDGLILADSFTSLASVLSGDVKNISQAIWSMMNQVLLDLNTLGVVSLPLGICEFTDPTCTTLLSREQMTQEQQDELDIVLVENSSFADYHRLYAHINVLPVIIAGADKTIEEALAISKTDLTKFFRSKLERQRTQARKLLDKVKPFAASFDQELQKNISDLDALIKGNPS